MAVKQLHLNDGSKTPIEPVISNDSIADNMITLNKLSEPVVTEDTYNQDKNTFVTKAELTPLQQKVDNNIQKLTTLESNVDDRITALEYVKQDTIDGKVTSFKKGTQFTGNLTLDVPTINDATMAGQTDIDGILAIPNNTDLQIEGKGLKQYIVDNIPPSTGGGGAGVQLSAPNTATNGTITQGQLTTLQESDLNYIIFNNEIYSLNDKTHTADTLTYSHVGFENGKHLLKTISITVSTRAWVLNTTTVEQGGGGLKLYRHNISASSSTSDSHIKLMILDTNEEKYTSLSSVDLYKIFAIYVELPDFYGLTNAFVYQLSGNYITALYILNDLGNQIVVNLEYDVINDKVIPFN